MVPSSESHMIGAGSGADRRGTTHRLVGGSPGDVASLIHAHPTQNEPWAGLIWRSPESRSMPMHLDRPADN